MFGQSNTGHAKIILDGVSQGIIDTYRKDPTSFSRVFTGLANGPHTLVVRVVGARNPFSGDNWVVVDYLDVWDGSTIARWQL